MAWRRQRSHDGYGGLVFLLLFIAITVGGLTVANLFSAGWFSNF